MRSCRSLLLCLVLTVLLAIPAYASSGYADVADNDWFSDAVVFCRERGIMDGIGDSRFSPNNIVDRAMAATTLWRLDGSPAEEAKDVFRDVQQGTWYEEAVSWAASKGIVTGYSGLFGVSDPLTREQLATMLWRYTGCPSSSDEADFDDFADVSPYAVDAVRWVSSAGIMGSVGNQRFAPKVSATRAQLALVLMRYVTYTKGAGHMSAGSRGFTAFDAALLDFLDDQGYSKQNYMVSPTSFRAALTLAVAGADNETKTQLIHAMGFKSMDDVNEWYETVRTYIDGFAKDLDEAKARFEREKQYMPGDAKAPDRAFSIANSVWHNADRDGTMDSEYIRYVEEHYDAEAADVAAAKLTDCVNDWVKDQTNGLIPSIVDDLSNTDSVLVNALYLRTSWVNEFSEWATAADDFTTIDGERVQKDFMNQKDTFLFYEDADSKLIAMPMEGGISAVFVLGSADSLQEKLERGTYEDVIVKLPKFEVETSLDKRELVNFLISQGAEFPFSSVPGVPDFSIMSKDAEWYISDIIQKSKIKVDEDGIEAAAVTAVMMAATSALIEDPPTPKEFIADRPFSFYLFTGTGDARELLFYGQLVR